MTLKELSQLYYLDREIELDRERLAELRANLLCPRSPNYDGMPRNPNPEPALARCIAEITDLEAIIQAKIEQRIYERARLERYISDIPDSLTRQIFTLRFIEGLTWEDVADKVGGHNTGYSVKKICYRFIAKN
ncbi:MAG TPA: hypothetical protein DEQ52_06705 [Ruminococcaceae bacterium]|nr:hypothetical protein [Oscillospiraceae bacterium]